MTKTPHFSVSAPLSALFFALLLVSAAPVSAQGNDATECGNEADCETDAAGDSYGDQPGAYDPYADPYDGNTLPGQYGPIANGGLDVGSIGPQVPNVVVNVDSLAISCDLLDLGLANSDQEMIDVALTGLGVGTVAEAAEICSDV